LAAHAGRKDAEKQRAAQGRAPHTRPLAGARPLPRRQRPPDRQQPDRNAIRPITLGRKNWLFIGATRAGVRAVAIMSLLAIAKANGLCPHAWMSVVLARLPTTLNRDIDTLLPLAGWQAINR